MCNTLLIMVVWHYYCYCSGAVVNVVYDLRCDKMRAVNDVDHHCVLLFFVQFKLMTTTVLLTMGILIIII